jgi:hypothetical protein
VLLVSKSIAPTLIRGVWVRYRELHLPESLQGLLIFHKDLLLYLEQAAYLLSDLVNFQHLAADAVLLVEFVPELGELPHYLEEARLSLRMLIGQAFKLLLLLIDLLSEVPRLGLLDGEIVGEGIIW